MFSTFRSCSQMPVVFYHKFCRADHRRCQNEARTSLTHSAFGSCAIFCCCSYHILTLSVIYYWTNARQHGTYLLNLIMLWKDDRQDKVQCLFHEASWNISFPPGWDIKLTSTRLYTWVERGTVRVKCFTQEHLTGRTDLSQGSNPDHLIPIPANNH